MRRAERLGPVPHTLHPTASTIRCSLCHNGPAFTDNKFHDVAVAQLGPGEGNGADGHDDFGRMNVTGQAADRYAFRTTPLRNVVLTGPYGHDGAFQSLRTSPGRSRHGYRAGCRWMDAKPG